MLGNVREAAGDEVHLPGQPGRPPRRDADRDDQGHRRPTASRPRPSSARRRGPSSTTRPTQTGLYHARWEPDGLLPFAVNLFDARESDLAPRGLVPDGVPADQADAYKIKIGYNPVAGTADHPAQSARTGGGRCAVLALVVVLVEWYIYNRRVYI